jgi:hypothetical protein
VNLVMFPCSSKNELLCPSAGIVMRSAAEAPVARDFRSAVSPHQILRRHKPADRILQRALARAASGDHHHREQFCQLARDGCQIGNQDRRPFSLKASSKPRASEEEIRGKRVFSSLGSAGARRAGAALITAEAPRAPERNCN